MKFFDEYKNNDLLQDKYSKNIIKDELPSDIEIIEDPIQDNEDKIKETLSNIEKIKDKVKSDIKNEKTKGDSFFDEEIFKNLDILHNFISSYIKDYPKYYDDKGNIDAKAFLDARELLKHELPLTAEEIIHTPTTVTGVTNDTKMNFENGYQVDFVGNVYNPNNEMIFTHDEPYQKIKYIDILNEKIITDSGIRIDMPDNFIDDFIMSNENVSDSTKNRIIKWKDKVNNSTGNANSNIITSSSSSNNNTSNNGNGSNNSNTSSSSSNSSSNNIYGTVNGVTINEEDKDMMELPLENVYVGDVFEDMSDIQLVDQMRRYQVTNEALGICNFKDIPYAKLNSLLLWGGGEKGTNPLASRTISDKDISFASDGTVYYSGSNSTVSTRRPGCMSKSFKTGHVCMYSDSNKMGLKTSIIQYLHKFGNTCGIFNANIPPLVGFKKFKIFPGLCIGGLLEILLMGWQERISKQINDMFQCIPAKYPYDASQSGFENETYQYGSSVSSLEELDKVKSCKVGDRYVVDVVPKNITGLKENACGVFIYDPNNKYSKLYKWQYKNFRGKPFNPKDNNNTNTIQGFENMYSNPIIQDTLMNTNALGEDSITRRLMSLQYAYQMKQALLSIKDVENSTDEIVSNAIYEVLDKLTDKLANYIVMLDDALSDKTSGNNIHIPSGKYVTSIGYGKRFIEHFKYLTTSGALKECPLEKCKAIKHITISGGNGRSSNSNTGVHILTIEYYDFSLYSPNEYLVPSYEQEHISLTDAMEFAYRFIPNSQLQELFEKNKSYMNLIDTNTSEIANVKTIRDYINISENKQGYENDINDNLKYIKRELDYMEFDERGFDQVDKRCFYTIDKIKMFN